MKSVVPIMREREPFPVGLADISVRIADRAGAVDAGEATLREDFDALRDAGVFTAALPEGSGGADLGLTAASVPQTCDLLRALGRANLCIARIVEGHINAVKLVHLHGTPEMRNAVFARVSEGAIMGVWGADAGPPVSLEEAGQRWTIRGAKRFASGLGDVSLAVVPLRDTQGRSQLVVVPVDEEERADPSTWTVSGMRGTVSGTYDLDGISVSHADLLGEPDDYQREPWFEGGIWRYCAAHVGGAEALVEEMRRALAERGHDGTPQQRERIALAVACCETGRLWTERSAVLVESAMDPEAAVAHALLGRETVERQCVEVMRLAERALGMGAFVEGTTMDRLRRDLSLYLRQAAPDAKMEAATRRLLALSRPVGAIW